MYKNYLFDFDGTLVDSMPTFASVMLKILDEHGIKYTDDIVKIITPLGYNGTARYFVELGLDMSCEDAVALMKSYAKEEYEKRIQAKESVPEVLKRLKQDGCSLNILTASPHSMLDCCLIRLGLFDLFTNVWSCEDFNTGKDNPDIYRMAAERLGVGVSDVLFLDDNCVSLETAKSAGMKVCGVYDSSSDDYVEKIKSLADYYVYSFRELSEI